MTENFEKQENQPCIFDNLMPPDDVPPPPKLTFSENMCAVAKKFKPATFTEYTNLDGLKQVKAGIGINLPFSKSDNTKITAGVEARVSLFNTPDGVNVTKGIVPTVRLSQDIGKNCKLTASIKPSMYEFAKIGFGVKF